MVRLEGSGFESRYRHVVGSLHIHPRATSNEYGPAWKNRPLLSHGPQSPAARKEAMTKEAALIN